MIKPTDRGFFIVNCGSHGHLGKQGVIDLDLSLKGKTEDQPIPLIDNWWQKCPYQLFVSEILLKLMNKESNSFYLKQNVTLILLDLVGTDQDQNMYLLPELSMIVEEDQPNRGIGAPSGAQLTRCHFTDTVDLLKQNFTKLAKPQINETFYRSQQMRSKGESQQIITIIQLVCNRSSHHQCMQLLKQLGRRQAPNPKA